MAEKIGLQADVKNHRSSWSVPVYGTTRVTRARILFSAFIISGIFLADYIQSSLIDRYITNYEITTDYVEAITSSGTPVGDINKYLTIFNFALSGLVASTIVNLVRRRIEAALVLVYVFSSTFVIFITENDEIVYQLGRSLRLINCFLVVPAIIAYSTRTAAQGRTLVRCTLYSFFAGYLYSSLTIIYRLASGDSSVFAPGFRYAAIPGHSTSTAATFVTAVFLLFIASSIPQYRQIPRAITRPIEAYVVVTAAVIVVLTGSRGPFLAVLIATMLYLVLRRRVKALCYAFSIAFAAIVAIIFNPEALAVLTGYFSSRSGTDISTGRAVIWSAASRSIDTASEFFFGWRFDSAGLPSGAAHNSVLGSLMLYGFPVSCVFFLTHFFLFRMSFALLKRSRHSDLDVLSARVLTIQAAILIYGLFENFFFLNNGAIMALYYVTFGLQCMFWGRMFWVSGVNSSASTTFSFGRRQLSR